MVTVMESDNGNGNSNGSDYGDNDNDKDCDNDNDNDNDNALVNVKPWRGVLARGGDLTNFIPVEWGI